VGIVKNGLVVDAADGTKRWYLNDVLHRVDGPAIEWWNGDCVWYLHGNLHRDGAPALEIFDGTVEWYHHGQLHREDGPAIVWETGSKYWYFEDKKHRVDGPAVEYADGGNLWWLNGVELEHPNSFGSMESWFEYLNENENETYQLIHDINGIIELIDNPSDKQTRVHQMRWVL